MTSSRREFLKRGTLMAFAASVPLSLSEKARILSPSRKFALNKAAFEAQLNTKFLINIGALNVPVTLVDVVSFASPNQTALGKEGFSLLFLGAPDAKLQQNTYLIQHQELGTFPLLIVPVGMDTGSGPLYEAVINRLNP
jgi:hypothetical protein